MAQKGLTTGGSSGVLYTDRRDFYIRPNVVKELWTDVTPFTTVVANRGVMTGLSDPTFKMFEHRNPWQKQEFNFNGSVTLNDDKSESSTVDIDGAVGLGGTATLADASWVGLQVDIWNSAKDTKKGSAIVTTVSADGTTIKLKNLSGAAADNSDDISVVDGDFGVVVGNAHGEGTEAPEAWADELEVVYNTTQIFKTPLQITGTLLQASLRGESSELARLRDQKSQEHKIQKERAFLFGRNPYGLSGSFANIEDVTDASSNVLRATMGIIPAIEEHGASSGDDQNIFTVSEASYAYGNFVDDMEKAFQYVPEAGMKRAFCGMGAMSYWSKMSGASGLAGNSGWTVNLGDMKRDSLGFNYRVLESPHGALQLIPTPALRGPYNKYMLVVSDENLSLMQYRAPKFQANIKQDNAYDGVKDQYMSDEGIGVTLIESHKLFKITA
jgi:hypothetical protein